MEIIYSSSESNIPHKPTGIGLGNFDGLHIGHMALINTLICESNISGLKSMIYTFTKHPENIIRKSLFTPLITTIGKKVSLLEDTKLEYLYFQEFDEVFSRMKPENFVKEVLIDRLKAELIVTGFNYRFGYRGEGDTELLKALGKKYGARVLVIPPVKIENEVVSSTTIRNYIGKGDMEGAFRLLGHHYSVTGEVLSGRQIGGRIGFPTANLIPENYLILPQKGVYITKTKIDGVFYPSITNVGKNPTFEELDHTSVETHILDFNMDIYSKKIEVFFMQKVRNERKFKDAAELVNQVSKDMEAAREYFSKA